MKKRKVVQVIFLVSFLCSLVACGFEKEFGQPDLQTKSNQLVIRYAGECKDFGSNKIMVEVQPGAQNAYQLYKCDGKKMKKNVQVWDQVWDFTKMKAKNLEKLAKRRFVCVAVPVEMSAESKNENVKTGVGFGINLGGSSAISQEERGKQGWKKTYRYLIPGWKMATTKVHVVGSSSVECGYHPNTTGSGIARGYAGGLGKIYIYY